MRKGGLSNQSAKLAAKWASKEIQKLVDVMVKVGSKNHDGFFETTFGVLHENTQGVFDVRCLESGRREVEAGGSSEKGGCVVLHENTQGCLDRREGGSGRKQREGRLRRVYPRSTIPSNVCRAETGRGCNDGRKRSVTVIGKEERMACL